MWQPFSEDFANSASGFIDKNVKLGHHCEGLSLGWLAIFFVVFGKKVLLRVFFPAFFFDGGFFR